MSELTGLDSIL